MLSLPPPLLGSSFPSPPFPSPLPWARPPHYLPGPVFPLASLPLPLLSAASRTQINLSLSLSCSSIPTPPESQSRCGVPGRPSLLTRACFPHLLPCFQNPRVSASEATLNCLLLPQAPCGPPSSPCPLLPPSRSLCPPEGGFPMPPSPRSSEESPRTPVALLPPAGHRALCAASLSG